MNRDKLYSRACFRGYYDVEKTSFNRLAVARIYMPDGEHDWKFLVMNSGFEGVGIYDTMDEVYDACFDGVFASYEEITFEEFIENTLQEVLDEGTWMTEENDEVQMTLAI